MKYEKRLKESREWKDLLIPLGGVILAVEGVRYTEGICKTNDLHIGWLQLRGSPEMCPISLVVSQLILVIS